MALWGSWVLVAILTYLIFAVIYFCLVFFLYEPSGGWGDFLLILPILPPLLVLMLVCDAVDHCRWQLKRWLWPKSIDDAVERLRWHLTDGERQYIARLDRTKVSQLSDGSVGR